MNGKKKVIFLIFLFILIIGASIGGYYWYQDSMYVTTNDARVAGELVKISPRILGELVSFHVEEGQSVRGGEILGRQEMNNLSDKTLDLAVIKAPVSGVVIKKQANVGEVVSPGQVLAMMVQKQDLYINANIEETDLTKIMPGQKVEVTIDSYSDIKLSGHVDRIGLATAATFSMLPISSGSGNFTKVVQRIPVKIVVDGLEQLDVSPGMSAEVKIHIK